MSTEVNEKPASKPGRKLITSEPKNKRTAQNRAAQRAFRERKERRMKELEEKVQLLEEEKTQIANESDLLRLQVKSLMSQLANYKQTPQTVSTASSDSTPSESRDAHSSISSASSIDNWKSPLRLDKDTMDVLNNATFKGDYNEDVFCQNLSEACGSKECPIPKTSSAASSAKVSPLTFGTAASADSPFDKVSSTLPDDDMGFLFDQGNTVMFENIADVDLFKNPNLGMDIYADLDANFAEDDIFGDILKSEGIVDSSIKKEPQAATPASSTVPDLVPEIQPRAAAQDSAILDSIVPNSDQSLMKCSQIWERVTAHPKFTDIDIDSLCQELKQKAKCSEKGVVVNGTDVGDILKTAVKQQQQLRRQQQQQPHSNMFMTPTW